MKSLLMMMIHYVVLIFSLVSEREETLEVGGELC